MITAILQSQLHVNSDPDTVKFLIELGADINQTDKYGRNGLLTYLKYLKVIGNVVMEADEKEAQETVEGGVLAYFEGLLEHPMVPVLANESQSAGDRTSRRKRRKNIR